MSVCIDEITVEGYTISVNLSHHAETKLKNYRITDKVVANEFRSLSFENFQYLKEYYGENPFLLNNIQRHLGIVFRVSGYRIFVITVILGKQLYNVKSDTSLVTIDNKGEIINIYKYKREFESSEEYEEYVDNEPLTLNIGEQLAGLL